MTRRASRRFSNTCAGPGIPARSSINTATADEITLSLGLSDKDAQAILDDRKANGKFADYGALAKVPGIDLKALEAHKDALGF